MGHIIFVKKKNYTESFFKLNDNHFQTQLKYIHEPASNLPV